MKKNKMMRAASVLLILVLLTTCTISGTFAKYTTSGTATDTARVAKWGVEISATGSAYSTKYKTTDSDYTGELSVKSSADEKVVAPGTSSSDVDGDLVFAITGQPEVASEIKIDFEVKSDIHYGNYYPVVFTLQVRDTNAKLTGSEDWKTVANGTLTEIEDFLETVYSTDGKFYAAVNEVLDAQYRLTWKWAFDGARDVNGSNLTADQIDKLDTLLGNLAAGLESAKKEAGTTSYSTKLEYSVTITVTQVD